MMKSVWLFSFFKDFLSNWGSLGSLLRASWEPLGSSWGSLGSLLGALGGLLGRLGSLVGRQECPEGVTLAILGRSWSALGASWSALGLSWRHLGRLLGAFWSDFMVVWGWFCSLESDLKRFVAILKNHEKHCKVLQNSRVWGSGIHKKSPREASWDQISC